MTLLIALEQAWKEVELAFKGGYLKNQTMLAFAWWKAIHKLRPDLHISYEADSLSTGIDGSDVLIWQDGEPPSVLFAGELKYFPDEFNVSELDITRLQHIDQNPNLMVPMRDPESGEIVRHQMGKSGAFAFGLFIVGRRDVAAVVHANVMRSLTQSGRAIFHFAFGAVSDDPALDSVFRYAPPGSVP